MSNRSRSSKGRSKRKRQRNRCPRLVLHVDDVNEKKSVLLTKDEYLIGRHPKCDIMLHSNHVSRLHFKLTRNSNNRFCIQDLGSRNGTYLNGQVLKDTLHAELKHEDAIRIADIGLQFVTQGRANERTLAGENLKSVPRYVKLVQSGETVRIDKVPQYIRDNLEFT